MIETYKYLSKILEVDSGFLEGLDKEMSAILGKSDVLEKVALENEALINRTLNLLDSNQKSAEHIRMILREISLLHEKFFIDFLEIIEGRNRFEKAVNIAKKIAKVDKGIFLKKELAEKFLLQREAPNLLKYLNCKNMEEVLTRYDVFEIWSALRFVESNEWMHQTFEEIYKNLNVDDFEEREIQIKVLGEEWHDVAQKFVAKKHHNVSHLKEFGIIFLNQIAENIPGKFLRDFALILHYTHEINFYSKMFLKYLNSYDFNEKFKSLLRGDVLEIKDISNLSKFQWLIVQRYLWKENSKDPRLFIQRVNPESLHWARGEKDLGLISGVGKKLDLNLWHNLDWVGGVFSDGEDQIVSFDLEDNVMSAVSFAEGKNEYFNYHQREAMWTKIFCEYVGGEEKMEEILINHFFDGLVDFKKI
ncbi:MAG: hypothetical protein NZ484_01825 [Patescibacteria group bacterium]|nr:hypothetical protein [Patescibacteria group bacterium]MDW8279674.1 hypothetical protein [bacterium]